MTKTINISMSEEDLEKIDTYCTKHALTRSKAFVQAMLDKVAMDEIGAFMRIMAHYSVTNEKLTRKDKKLMADALKLMNDMGGGSHE